MGKKIKKAIIIEVLKREFNISVGVIPNLVLICNFPMVSGGGYL